MRASNLVDRITRRVETIGDLPRAGRKVPEFDRDDLREVAERPYRIIYRIRPDEIEVVTVIHYRQLLSDDLVEP